MKNSRLTKTEIEFLDHSNRIEGVYSKQALEDAKDAWRYAKSLKKMTMSDVFEIHRRLMRRIDPDIAGRLRTYDVFIGGERKKFRGLPLLESQLRDVVDHMNEELQFNYKDVPSMAAGVACGHHILFEKVHPFPDGNGRSGRILWNWHRLRLGLPIQVIHEGREHMAYYLWFRD